MTTRQPIQVNALNYWVLRPEWNQPRYYRTMTMAENAAIELVKDGGEATYGMVRPDTFSHVQLGSVSGN